MNKLVSCMFCFIVLALPMNSFATDFGDALQQLQHDWAVANYELQGEPRKSAFATLADKSGEFTQEYPNDAEAWIWDGIIKSTYAGEKGGLGALALAKRSRKSLEKAMSIDDTALDGSAYTSLGTLYYKVPGWPAGFGSDKKAAVMLQKALVINPDGIDPNYFYADFLRDQKKYADAEKYYLKAQQATLRPNRPIADKGRQKEIELALVAVRTKLGT